MQNIRLSDFDKIVAATEFSYTADSTDIASLYLDYWFVEHSTRVY
jgi:hypothetical protein